MQQKHYSSWQHFKCWIKGHKPYYYWQSIGSMWAYNEVWGCKVCKYHGREERLMEI